MSGMVTGLFLAQEKRSPMLQVEAATAIAGHGLDGCRHARRAPGGKRQVLLMDPASIEGLDLAPGALKENILVAGLALETLPPGQRLALGPEVVVELTEACVPCQRLEAIRPGLLKASWGRRGQLARVLVGGGLRVGDEARLLDINPDAPRKPRPKLPG